MNVDLLLQIVGSVLGVVINHESTSDADKAKLQSIIDRLSTLETKEQKIADGLDPK